MLFLDLFSVWAFYSFLNFFQIQLLDENKNKKNAAATNVENIYQI